MRCWLKATKISALGFYSLKGAPHWPAPHTLTQPRQVTVACLPRVGILRLRRRIILLCLIAGMNAVPTGSLLLIGIAF